MYISYENNKQVKACIVYCKNKRQNNINVLKIGWNSVYDLNVERKKLNFVSDNIFMYIPDIIHIYLAKVNIRF